MATAACEFTGNPDLYGLGIRTGIYTQVFSTLITNHFLPGELSSTWTANIIFVSALLLAMIKSISQASDFFVVEGFILLQLILLFFLTVISNSGTFFIFMDTFCAFLDGTLNADTYRALKEVGDSSEQVGVIMIQHLSKLSQAYSDISPLASTICLVLTLMASGLNLWYWISGTQALRREDVSCSTDVFLFAPVDATGSARYFFIVIGSLYAAYQLLLLFFTRMFFLLQKPEESYKQKLLSVFDPRSPVERARSDQQGGHLPIDKFNPPKRRPHTTISRRIRFCFHAFTFAYSSGIIVWSILAVELTLSWNNVKDIYSVDSTGQLIPLFIGLAGLARAILFAFLEHADRLWKKSANRPSIVLQPDTGIYHYWVPPSRDVAQKITFKAQRPSRRWSYDEKHNNTVDAPAVESAGKHKAPAPALPLLPKWKYQRLRKVSAWRELPRVRKSTGRFIYMDRNGGQHVFHNLKRIRRASFPGNLTDEPPVLRPHRERRTFRTSLRDQQNARQLEHRREVWWQRKLESLEHQRRSKKHTEIPDLSSERWQRFKKNDPARSGSRSSRSSRSSASTDVSGPPWLPADVDDENLLWMRSYRDAFPPSRSSSTATRRKSLDDARTEYIGLDGHMMPFLRPASPGKRHSLDSMPKGDSRASPSARSVTRGRSRWPKFDRSPSLSDRSDESMVYVRRESRSRSSRSSSLSSSRFSTTSNETDDGKEEGEGEVNHQKRKKKQRKNRIIRACFGTLLVCINLFCLCSPCYAVGYTFVKYLKRRWQASRYGRTVDKNRKSGPIRTTAALYYCPACDRELRCYEHSRDWYTVRAPDRKPKKKKGQIFPTALDELFGTAYTLSVLAHAARALFLFLKRMEWSRDLGTLAKARLEHLIDGARAYKEEEEAKVAESASSPV